tara:strand:+ start:190 stop:504 length:315 start_codon:yes stop_codon:yes gene_type:complete
MFFLIKLFFLLFFLQRSIAAEQDNYVNIFQDVLLEYNVIYDKLEEFKSGAICIPKNSNNVFNKYAVGFSYSIYDKETSKLIALQGCKDMKKKLILYDCKCEVIL